MTVGAVQPLPRPSDATCTWKGHFYIHCTAPVGEEGVEPPKPKRLVYSQVALTTCILTNGVGVATQDLCVPAKEGLATQFQCVSS